MKKYNIAVVGATGMVGRKFLQVLEERNLPVENYYLFASARSAGKSLRFMGKDYTVLELTETCFDGKNIAEEVKTISAMVNKMSPTKLCRYRSVSPNNLEALRTNKLHFSTSDYYDDPFDTFLHIDTAVIHREIKSAMTKPNTFEMLELFKEKYELPIPNKIIAEIASDIDFEFAFNNAKSYIQKNVRNVMRRTMQSILEFQRFKFCLQIIVAHTVFNAFFNVGIHIRKCTLADGVMCIFAVFGARFDGLTQLPDQQRKRRKNKHNKRRQPDFSYVFRLHIVSPFNSILHRA